MPRLPKPINIGRSIEGENDNSETARLVSLLQDSEEREATLRKQLAEQQMKNAPRGDIAGLSLEEIADKYELGEEADDFDVTAEIENDPEVIEGIIPLPGVGLLAGMSQTGKTAVGLSIVAHLVRGDDWNGRRVTGRQGVLYYAYEGANSVKWRMKAIAQEIGERMHNAPFYPVLSDPVRLDSKGAYAVMFGTIRHHQERCREEHGCELTTVFIDTAIASGMITDDGDQKQWNFALPLLKEISRTLHVTFAVMTHSAKGEGGAIVRGSGASYDHADFVIGLRAENVDGERGRRFMFLEKHRDEETGYLTDYSMRSVKVGVKASGDPRFAPVVEYSGPPEKPVKEPEYTIGEIALRKAIAKAAFAGEERPLLLESTGRWYYSAAMYTVEQEARKIILPNNFKRDFERAINALKTRDELEVDDVKMRFNLTTYEIKL